MSRKVVTSEHERQELIGFLLAQPLPVTVTVKKGKPRSPEQNRLMRLWCKELEEQGDMTSEEYRGYIKAWFGLPILIRDDDEYAEAYRRIVQPLDYEDKLELMRVPIDYPVTRRMSTKQEKEMLDAVYASFTGEGFRLTDPETLKCK